MTLIKESIRKTKDADHPNMGDLFEEVHVVAFTTTAETVEITTGLTGTLAYGWACPFAVITSIDAQDTPLNVHPTVGVDTASKVTVRRQASGTSALQICVVIGGYKTATS